MECGDKFAIHSCLESHYLQHKLDWEQNVSDYDWDLDLKYIYANFESDEMTLVASSSKKYTFDKNTRSVKILSFISLRFHMRLKANNKKYKCNICKKLFNSKLVRSVHKRVHFRNKPYDCMECGEEFGFQSYLFYHLQMHKMAHSGSVASKTFKNNMECVETEVFNPPENMEVALGSKILKRYTGKIFIFWNTKIF